MSLNPSKSIRNDSLGEGSLYGSDGSLTDNRTVDGDGHDLTLTDIGTFTVSADTINLDGDLEVDGAAPFGYILVGNGTSYEPFPIGITGQVLEVNPFYPSGLHWVTPSGNGINLYSNDGALTGARVVTGSGFPLTFTGMSTITLDATTVDLKGNLLIDTDATKGKILIANGTSYEPLVAGVTGQVLTVDGTAPSGLKWSDSSSFYASDGTLTSNRTVTGASNTLSFTGLSNFNVSSTVLTINSSAPKGSLLVGSGTSYDQLPVGASGYVLVSSPASTDGVEWLVSPAATNIYNSNGTLTANRTVTGAGFNLGLTGVNIFDITATRFTLNSSAIKGTVLAGTGSTYIASTTGATGQVLTVDGTVSAGVSWQTPAPDTNIYNSNGSLTANRTLTGAGFSLAFNGVSSFSIGDGTTTSINLTSTALTVNSVAPKGAILVGTGSTYIAGPTGTTGQVLTVDNTSPSGLTFATPASTINIYNTNGSLTSNRTLTGSGFSLSLTGLASFNVTTPIFTLNSTAPKGAVLVGNNTTYIAGPTGATGQVLTVDNTVSSGVSWQTPAAITNIFNSDGTLTANRILTGAGFNLTMLGIGAYSVNAVTSIDFTTPILTFSGAAVKGSLQAATGTTYTTLPVGASGYFLMANPSTSTGLDWQMPNNIYNYDGTLIGNRIVTCGTNNLSFTGSGASTFSISNPTFNIASTSFTRLGLATKGTLLAGTGTSYNATPVGTNTFVLTADSSTVTGVAWALPNNLYNNNGNLTSNRVVGCGAFSLNFTGSNTITLGGGVLNLAGTSLQRNGSAVKGSLLTGTGTSFDELGVGADNKFLMADSSALAGVSWQPASNIYTDDGNLDSNRIVGCGVYDLTITTSAIIALGGGSGTVNLNSTVLKRNNAAPKGSLLAGTSTSYDPVAVGSNGQVLTADSSASGGVAWMTPTAVTNIYNSDGSLTGNRVVTTGSNNLTFTGTGTISLSGTAINLIGNLQRSGLATKGTVLAGNGSSYVAGPTGTTGQVLTVDNTTSTGFIFATPVNIYSADGTLTGNRIVSCSSNNLTVSGTSTSTLTVSTPSFNVSSTNFTRGGVAAKGSLLAGTSTSYDAVAVGSDGQVLTANSASGSGVSWTTPTPSTNIYNSDGSLTGNRTVTCGTNNLNFTGTGSSTISLGTISVNISATNLLRSGLATKGTVLAGTGSSYIASATGATGQVLTVDGTVAAGVSWQTPTPITNIYNSDGSLTSTRVVTCGSFNLTFTGSNTIAIGGTTLNLNATSLLRNGLATKGSLLAATGTSYDNLAVGANGLVLTADSSAGAGVAWQAPNNIYSADGSLTGNRTVTTGANNFSVTGTGTISLSGTAINLIGNLQRSGSAVKGTVLAGTGSSYVASVTGSTGQVLTVDGTVAAGVSWQTPAAVTNIYNSDGSLTGNRVVTCGTNNLSFTGTSSSTISLGTVSVNISATNFTRSGLAVKGTVLAGTGTSYVASATGATGQVLTVDGTATAGVSWQTPAASVNIYNSDGTLTGNRVVTCGTNNLTFTGSGGSVITLDGPILNITATNWQRNGTAVKGTVLAGTGNSYVASATGATGQVLTVDGTVAAGVSWQTPAAGTNIYNSDGTLTGNRIVTCGTNNLTFTGSGGSVITLDGPTLNITATNWQRNGTAVKGTILAGTGTSYVASTTGATGQVLTVDGTVAAGVSWQTPAASVNIYNSDGTLTGNRTVTGGGNALSFNNLGTFNLTATNGNITGTTWNATLTTLNCTITTMSFIGATLNIGQTILQRSGAAPKGSLLVGTSTSYDPVAVGTNGAFLVADSTVGPGVKWDTRLANPSYGSMYISAAAATTITVAGTYYKAAGTTTAGLISSDWSMSANNRLTYNGATTQTFQIDAVCFLTPASSSAFMYGIRFYKSGVLQTRCTPQGNMTSTLKDSLPIQDIISFANGDYIELWITNYGGTTAVTVSDMNFRVVRAT